MAMHERKGKSTSKKCPTSLQEVMAVSSFAEYMQAVGSVPVYSPTEQARRFRLLDEARQQGNGPTIQCLTDDLTFHNLRFVISLAKRYQGNGVDLEDLVQEGNRGLMRAVERFEVEKGFRFTTFSSWLIRSRMSSLVDRMGNPVKLPEDLNRLATAVDTAMAELVQELGTEQITSAQIADHLQIPIEQVNDLMMALTSRHLRYLHEPAHTVRGQNANYTLQDSVEDRTTLQTHELAIQHHSSDEALRLLAELPRVVREVIARRTGLLDGREQTWTEIAKATNHSLDFVKSVYLDGITFLRDDFTDGQNNSSEDPIPTSDDVLEHLGLTRRQWQIWSVCEVGSIGKTTRELAEFLGISKSELVQALRKIHERIDKND